MLRQLSDALLPQKNHLMNVHIALKMIFTLINITLALLSSYVHFLAFQMILLIILFLISRLSKNVKNTFRAALYPIALISISAFIFYGLSYMVLLVLRVITIILTINLLVITVRPVEFSIFLEKLRFPRVVYLSLEMAFRVIPAILNDSEEALMTLTFKEGRKRNTLVNALAVLLITADEYNRGLQELLISKYYGVKNRKIFYEYALNKHFILMIFVLAIEVIMWLALHNEMALSISLFL